MPALRRTFFITTTLILWVGIASAATIEGILEKTKDILLTVVSLLLVVGTIVFLWGIVRYVSAGGDEEKIKEGRSLIIFGIIGLAVMVSVWGLVQLITSTFGIGGEQIPLVR